MKEKLLNFTFCFLCFVIIFFIFKNNNMVAKVIIDAVNLFLNKVFVSLFPMFILNDLLIASNLPYYFYRLFNSVFKKIFHVSGMGAYAFIMSLISGTPSQAYILKNLVQSNIITVDEANHFLYFTYFSNPLFLTMMLSLIFPISIVIKLIAIHYGCNIIIAILFRKKAPKVSENSALITHNSSMGSVLTSSIKKSVSTLLMILGTIVVYMLLSYIIVQILPLNHLFKVLLSGFLEITNGLHLLTNLDLITKLKEIIAIGIISFGGLSIHTQIKAILEDTNISYAFFLKGRMLQASLGVILTILF